MWYIIYKISLAYICNISTYICVCVGVSYHMSWLLNNTGLNCMGPLICRLFSAILYYPSYSWLNSGMQNQACGGPTGRFFDWRGGVNEGRAAPNPLHCARTNCTFHYLAHDLLCIYQCPLYYIVLIHLMFSGLPCHSAFHFSFSRDNLPFWYTLKYFFKWKLLFYI